MKKGGKKQVVSPLEKNKKNQYAMCMSHADHQDSTAIKVGRANHFIDEVGMKGLLTLSSRELCFQTHQMNFKQYTVCIPLEQITTARKKNNMRIFPYGILVTLKTGEEHRFAVWGRGKWVTAIERALADICQKKAS